MFRRQHEDKKDQGLPYSSGSASNGSMQQQVPFQTNFASMSIHESDKLRMLGFPMTSVDTVRNVIASTWAGGIQREREYYGSIEFKLKGYPWNAHGTEAVTSRQLMSCLLAALFQQGWMLTMSTDVSKCVSDADTLLFRHQSPGPAACDWMAISFSNSDQIRFITQPVNNSSSEVVNAYIASLGNAVQRHEPHKVPGCYEVKLVGNPWRASGGGTMSARMLLLTLLNTLERFGWTVYGSVDQKRQSDGESQSGDTDTWHCCRQIGWHPGMPVYHN